MIVLRSMAARSMRNRIEARRRGSAQFDDQNTPTLAGCLREIVLPLMIFLTIIAIMIGSAMIYSSEMQMSVLTRYACLVLMITMVFVCLVYVVRYCQMERNARLMREDRLAALASTPVVIIESRESLTRASPTAPTAPTSPTSPVSPSAPPSYNVANRMSPEAPPPSYDKITP